MVDIIVKVVLLPSVSGRLSQQAVHVLKLLENT